MSKPIPLDEQIVAALTSACTSAAAAAVLEDAERLLTDLTKQADAADVASLSPLATSTEARTLRREAEDRRFDADRMEASVSALSARVSELEGEERSAARDAARIAAIAERDALASEIAEEYPRIVFALTSLAKRIAENDELCRLNSITESAEAIGRGVPTNFYVGGTCTLHRIGDMKVGMPTSGHMAWDADGTGGWRWPGLTLARSERPAASDG
ncbi:hypothetical protein [Sphingomonas echinoides]|uniref:hypothetical protein n=1 Tax=Sphingomonas echinoides TaxID=59803 RepID=UPI002413A52C|nr:hypothetical protein [Sphingomonas echinoides]